MLTKRQITQEFIEMAEKAARLENQFLEKEKEFNETGQTELADLNGSIARDYRQVAHAYKESARLLNENTAPWED